MQDGQLVAIDSDDDANAMMKTMMGSGGKFLPRVQFMGSSSEKCKSGEFPINHFALVDNGNFVDIGEALDVIVIASRPKALDTQLPLTSYIPALDADDNFTGDFAEIVERAGIKDSGCMWGPEFLVYLTDAKKWATFFMSSITMRNDAPKMQAKLGFAVTLKGRLIETKSYKYFSPNPTPCDAAVEAPPAEEVSKQLEAFKNPPKPDTERADEKEADATERQQ